MAINNWKIYLPTLLLFASPLAQAASWQIIPDKSLITFTATQNGSPVTGTFKKFNGTIDFDAFAQRAALPQVKMIEVKLSQGAKPGHGGI